MTNRVPAYDTDDDGAIDFSNLGQNANIARLDQNETITQDWSLDDDVDIRFGTDDDLGLHFDPDGDGWELITDPGGTASVILSAVTGGTLTVHNDLNDGAGNTVYDQSNNHVPEMRVQAISNSGLVNSSVTVAGNSVDLGGTTAVASTDLSDSADLARVNSAETISGNWTFSANAALNDDVQLQFGTDADWHWDYDSANGWLELSDGTNNALEIHDTSLDVEVTTGDLTDGADNVVYDQSNNHVPETRVQAISNSGLVNSSVTVAGNSVSLGGSTSVASTDLSDSSDLARVNSAETISSNWTFAANTKVNDDVQFQFGTDTDWQMLYDSANGWFELSDGTSNALEIHDTSLDVEVTTGDLTDGSDNVVYDQSNNHVPFSRLGQSANIARLDQQESIAADWTLNDDIDIRFGTDDDFGIHFDPDGDGWELNANPGGATAVILSAVTGGTLTVHNDLNDDAGNTVYDQTNNRIGTDRATATSVDFGDGLEDDGSDTIQTEEPFSYAPGMTEWEDGLSNEEIDRINLQTGETLVVDRIEFRQKGGGSSASASIDVRDTGAGSTIGSQDLGGTTKDPGSSNSGNTIIVRVSNSTGGAINAAPRVTGRIQGA